MMRYFILMCICINPLNNIQLNYSRKYHSRVDIVAMVPPPGDNISKKATNIVVPPGCSINRTETNRPDGSVQVRETATCTTITEISPSGKVTTKPKTDSKQDQKDKKMASEHFNRRK